jgi:hypothetical protein
VVLLVAQMAVEVEALAACCREQPLLVLAQFMQSPLAQAVQLVHQHLQA